MISCKIPSPDELSSERALGLMSSQHHNFDSLPPQSQALKQSFLACDASDEAPIIVFISKMIPVSKF
jgi:ribosome assembly protein 1